MNGGTFFQVIFAAILAALLGLNGWIASTVSDIKTTVSAVVSDIGSHEKRINRLERSSDTESERRGR